MQSPSTPSIARSPSSNRAWVWILALAVLLILLGVLAMSSLSFAAKVYVIASGWMLIIGGVLQMYGAFLFRGFGGLRVHIFLGLLIAVLGVVLIWAPVTVDSLFALLIVIGLLADAVLEAISAVVLRSPGWIWPVLIGAFSLVVGLIIILNPSLLLALLGLMVGISLLMRGVVLLLVALDARKLNQE